MPISNAWGNAILQFQFNGVAFPSNYTNASLYLALHTADPGVGGTQNTSEISYTGYARLALVRNTTGECLVSGKNMSNQIARVFGAMSGGAGGTVTHITLGELSSGAGIILFAGAVTPTIPVTTNVQPNFPIGALTFVFA